MRMNCVEPPQNELKSVLITAITTIAIWLALMLLGTGKAHADPTPTPMPDVVGHLTSAGVQAL
jgi:hypothetical protein